MTRCICGQTEGREFAVPECQLGIREYFTYVECLNCGSLRIATIPLDLDRFYPQNYYSYADRGRGWRDRVQVPATWLALNIRFPRFPDFYFHWPFVLQTMKITTRDRVLDVGSGATGMAGALRAAGHRQALGVDPFIRSDIHDENGLAIKKAFLSELTGEWDVIAFNHSLEHVPEPEQELRHAKALLSARGRIAVRIPVAAWAYRHYGPFWRALDAPRHLFVPTEKGFAALASTAGLRIEQVIFDSDFRQFWQSDLYQNGLALVPPGSSEFRKSISRRQQFILNQRARDLDRKREGDQAAFLLRPS